MLDEEGALGTFYIAAGTCGSVDENWRLIERDQVRALFARGHEIGCHTFSHVNVEKLGSREMRVECERNLALLRQLCGGIELTNFCYPFGRLSLPRKLQLGRRFDTCRSIYEGVNAGTIDLALLRVIELYDRTLTPEKLADVLSETRERNGWLIFYTHDVTTPPSAIGCSPALLRSTIRAARKHGLKCVPVREAVIEIGYRVG